MLPMASSERAAFVCDICKARKKACDKILPRCGYCNARNLDCTYGQANIKPKGSVAIGTLSDLIACTSEQKLAGLLNLQLCHLIQLTGLNLREIGEKYMRAFAPWLPLISRPALEEVMRSAEHDVPSVDVAMLLLAMFLVSETMRTTNSPSSDLYLALKLFFQQVHATIAISRHIVHAGVLLTVFEYATMNIEVAYASLGTIARLASMINLPAYIQSPTPVTNGDRVVAAESRNLWWSIIIIDSLIILELPDRPTRQCTAFPSGDTFLPSNLRSEDLRSLDGPTLLPLDCKGIGTFARAAQATLLLNQALKYREAEPTMSSYHEMQSLDNELQSFLRIEMIREHELHSDAATIVLRALIFVHINMLKHPHVLENMEKNEASASSHATIESSVRMILTAVHHHQSDIPHVETISPLPRHTLRLAMQHVRQHPHLATDEVLTGMQSAEALEQTFRSRWA